jgi:hypothetical protein
MINVRIAKVISTIDSSNEGRFKVTFPPRCKQSETANVIYTSPSYSIYEGGFFAPPTLGSEVLVFQADDQNYYYLSTIVSFPKLTCKPAGLFGKIKDFLVAGKKIFNSDNQPKAIYLTNTKGAGIKISNYYNNDGSEIPRDKVTVNSTQGHKLVLSDNPNLDCVILRNKDGDGITITANSNPVHSSNSIVIKSKSSQRYVADAGELRFTLTDGRDLILENNSTGINSGAGSPYGNVNLVSKWKDINIYTQGAGNPITGDAGRVLISTPNGVIQLNSGGDVTIYAKGDINIASEQNINMEANDINLRARGDINVRSDGAIRTLSQQESELRSNSSVNIRTPGTIEANSSTFNMDSQTFLLNSVASNIAFGNGGGPIWSPASPGILTLPLPTPLVGAGTIEPVSGAYGN